MLNEIKHLFHIIESFLCKENICDHTKSYLTTNGFLSQFDILINLISKDETLTVISCYN